MSNTIEADTAELKKLRRMVANTGVCEQCEGTGMGEGEPVPYGSTTVLAPTSCEHCMGGSKAFEQGAKWLEEYYRSISGCPEGTPLWTHISGLLASRCGAEKGFCEKEGSTYPAT